MPCQIVCLDPVPPGVPRCPCLSDEEFVNPPSLREEWEKWDLRVQIMFILYLQLFLHLFGRLRRKRAHFLIMNSVWGFYLLVELLASISLGKLSNATAPFHLLRGLWAPIIFFYLGGPDTITVLRLDENNMWLRHLIGLFTNGIRTSYVLYATWTKSLLSVLAMLMLIAGIIKYGERVWIIRSRVKVKNPELYIQSNESTDFPPDIPVRVRGSDKELVLLAYSYFQTLKPHIPNYVCERRKKEKLVKEFQKWQDSREIQNIFQLIEIELGFAYDMLYSKVDRIFTVWGFILRVISISCIVAVLLGFISAKGHLREYLKGDIPVTIILLVGAIFLEIGGVLVQLTTDWAIVWASKNQGMLLTPIFHLHKFVNSKSKRWSEFMGQINLLDISVIDYRMTKFKVMVHYIFGSETILNNKFGLPLCPVKPRLKEIIINRLRETLQNDSTLKRGWWSLEQYNCLEEFKWSIELEFSESITIWHIATDICYHLEEDNSVKTNDELMKTAKILSSYMMHILLICHSRLPICNTSYEKFRQACADLDKFFEEGGYKSSIGEARKRLLNEQCDSSTIKNIQKLANALKGKVNKWTIMSNVWVEMLCYAASNCGVTNHIKELVNGGELLTHVWLLLLHFGIRNKPEEYATPDLERVTSFAKGEASDIIKSSKDTQPPDSTIVE